MNKRFVPLCLLLPWMLPIVAAGPVSAAGRPNILFIMSDDHALEGIAAYGSWLKDCLHTPNIDRLAGEGMRFDNVCCNNSICSPSRASILTGQYSHKNGVPGLGGTISEDSPWVSAQLQRVGYQTCIVGKYHLGGAPKGFDDYWITRGQGSWYDPKFYRPGMAYGRRAKSSPEQTTGYCSDVYTDVALDWLAGRDADRPFCLMLHFKAPHHSYEYPERWNDYLADVSVPEPASLHEDVEKASPLLKAPYWAHMIRERAYYGRHENDTHPPMPDNDGTDRGRASAAYQHMIKKYIRCVAAVDDNVKRVLDYLDDNGLVDDTLVMYTGDQGYWLGQHGFYDKRLILEGSLKMPLLVRYPGKIEAGSVNHDLCSNVDFAETMLDYAGARTPDSMQGRSLRPLLEGRAADDWRTANYYCYWGGPPPHWGVRTGRYTLVCFPGTEEIEFYDLLADPEQITNLAGNPEYAEPIAECRKQLARMQKSLDVKPEDLPKMKMGSGRE